MKKLCFRDIEKKLTKSKSFRPPPFATRPKFFAPPLTKKLKVPKIPTKHEKLCFMNIEKN